MKEIEYEQMLCAWLVTDGISAFNRVRSIVKSECFYNPECKKIYQYFEGLKHGQEKDFSDLIHIVPGSRLYWYMNGAVLDIAYCGSPESLAIKIWENDRDRRLKLEISAKNPDKNKIIEICQPNPGLTTDSEFMTLEDIYVNPIETSPIIDGLLDEGDNIIIYAPGGCGKSLITLYMSLCIAPGNDFLGFHVSKPRNTLFLQSENSRNATYSRLLKIFDGEPDLKIGLQQIFFPKNIQISGFFNNPDFQIRIENLIRSIEEKTTEKIDVIVVDPLISFHDADENDNSRMRSTLDCLQDICNKTACVPIVVHHANKENGLRGASSIIDWARIVVKMDRKIIAGAEFVEISCEKSNNHPKFQPFAIQFDQYLIPQILENKGLDEKKTARCETVEKALRLLGGTADSQMELVKQYMEISGMKSRSAVVNHINEAVKFGFIEESENITETGSKILSYRSNQG